MVYTIEKMILLPLYKMWLRNVEGVRNIPKDKIFIIAVNHSSYFDIFLPPILVAPKAGKKIRAWVNSYYWKPFIAGFFLDLWEAIPVFVEKEKDSKKKNKISFNKTVKCLKNNELVMIFPEGTRSPDGKLKKAYTGIARLALKTKVPVLPIGLIGFHKALPRGKIFPRFKRCEVKIGKPITFEKYYSKNPNKKIFEEVTRIIMKEIAKLIGQKYNY